MKRPLLRFCPICDSSEGEVLHSQAFVLPDDSPLPDCYDVVYCPTCGFCFADTSAAQEKYSRYYRLLSKYAGDSHAAAKEIAPNRERYIKQAKVLAPLFKAAPTKILDIGCACGGLLTELSQLGFTALTGLDPSECCVRYVRSLGMNAFQGDLFDLADLRDQKFDAIILSHVLEHVRDVHHVPEIIDSLLTPNGLCYIEVPDAAAYGTYPIAPFDYFNCEHINHFDDIALDNLFLQNGFRRTASGKTAYLNDATPAVYCVYRKEMNGRAASIRRTDEILRGIRDHLAWSESRPMEKSLTLLAQSGVPVVVWGAGQMTMRLLATTTLRNCNILFFVDNNYVKHHSVLHGVSILPPSALQQYSGTILVASAHFADEIIAEIRGSGYDNPVIDISRCVQNEKTSDSP